MLGNVIGGFIVLLVGTTLVGPVADTIKAAQTPNSSNASAPSNLSGATSTIVGLVTLFYCLGVMSVGIAIAVNGLKDAGLM